MSSQEGDRALNQILEAISAAENEKPPENPDDVPLDEPDAGDSVPGSGLKKFEGAEHRSVGDNIILYDINGKPTNPPASEYTIVTLSKLVFSADLTYGQVVSMAGDFYTNPKDDYAPICGAYGNPPVGTASDRFANMITSMVNNDWLYAQPVSDALDKEKKVIDSKMGADGGQEAAAYHSGKGMQSDAEYALQTSAAYPKMSWQNADHFGKDALKCYKVGHALACKAAIEAGLKTNSEDRAKGLKNAYFIEAASNHYLTDLFSSGHQRVPRRAFHYDNYLTMMAVGIAGQKGYLPVWDSMCRVMHDDDNATGLMSTNGNGEQWIAFGDKQLFMPGNGVNRVRCVYTVQKSIDEVFSYFQNPKDQSGNRRVVSEETPFTTLNLIPQPFPNSKSELDSSGSPDSLTDNPAPLWIPNENKVSKEQSWTYRQQIDNHASFALATGRPGFVSETPDSWFSRPECTQIYGSAFRSDDQFPTTVAVECGVGLLQLSQASSVSLDNKQDWVNATCWSPVRFPNIKYANIPRSVTLRSKQRLNDLKLDKGADTPIVHSLGWFDGSKTISLIFQQPTADLKNPSKLLASMMTFSDPNQGKSDQFDFTPGVKQGKIASKVEWVNKSIFTQAGSSPVDMMDLRCLPFHDQQLTRPRVINVVCGDSTVNHSRVYLDDASVKDGVITVDPWTKKDSSGDPDWPSRPFVKASNAGQNSRKVLFCQRSAVVSNKWMVRVASLEVIRPDGDESLKWNQTFLKASDGLIRAPSSGPYNQIRSSCFLIGDITGAGKWPIGSGVQGEQVTVVNMSPTYTQLDTLGYVEGQSGQWRCKHDCADDLNKGPANSLYQGQGYLRDYFISLIPSQYGAGAGCDVLHVSSHTFNGKYYLKFKTHVNDRSKRDGKPVPGKQMDYFGNCNINWIPDEFMSKDRYESGRYQSLKWLFMPHANSNKKNAIMEVFSWYGILGLRYFAAKWDGQQYNYEIVGVQPFNGQTSSTIGRGVSGSWGEGFIPMGSSQDFIDVNYYNMVLGGEKGHGYWDSAKMDTKKWNDPGVKGSYIRKESDYVRGVGDDVTKLEA